MLRGGPLSSLKILDLTCQYGAFASRLLCDLGADVLRIDQPPGAGASAAPPDEALERHLHAGKRRRILDLSLPAGRDHLLQLLATHDVLIESAPPRHLEPGGFSYAELSRLQPRLIRASVTGLGRSGPYAAYRSSDAVAAALGGQMFVCGPAEGAPVLFHSQQAGLAASLQTAAGILLAVARRHRTQQGSCFEVSLQEAAASSLDHVLVRYLAEGAIAGRTGSRHWNDLFCIVPSADGWMQITPFLMWDTLVALMAQEDRADDLTAPCWEDEAYRHAHADQAIASISRWTQTRTSEHLFDLGQSLRLPWAPVVPPEQLRHSPQLQARGFFRNCAYPYRFSRFEPPAEGQAPRADVDPDGAHPRGTPPACAPSIHRPRGDRPAADGVPPPAHALQGLRILDFTRVLAGPYATRMLADFGAEVIKVQSHLTATGSEAPDAPYFAAWNRNKRSITLDLSQPEARDLVRRLVPLCDAVVENFSRRVMAHWELDYAHLSKLNPSLVMLSMSGMGHTGPWRDGVAYGPTVEALAGLTHAASRGQPAPVGLGFAYADSISGLYGVTALLAALEWRRGTGCGQHIDLSEYEAVATLLGPQLAQEAEAREARVPQTWPGAQAPQRALHLCLPCQGADRWCVLELCDDQDWSALCGLAPQAAWARDTRFKSGPDRQRHALDLQLQLAAWSRPQAAHPLMARLQGAGLAAGVVQDAADLASDPHLQARGFFVEVAHPARGRIRSDRTPIRFDDDAPQAHGVPGLGQDNRHVFQTLLGLDEAEFDRLVAARVIW